MLDTPAYHSIGPADRPVTSDDPVSLKDLPGPETYTVLEVAARALVSVGVWPMTSYARASLECYRFY